MCVVHEVAHQGQVAVVGVHDVFYDVSRHDDRLLQDLLGYVNLTVSLATTTLRVLICLIFNLICTAFILIETFFTFGMCTKTVKMFS